MNYSWKDVTSHSRRETEEERKQIQSVEAQIGREARLVVTRRHGLDGWYIDLHLYGINYREARSDSLDDAKVEAVELAKATLNKIVAALERLATF